MCGSVQVGGGNPKSVWWNNQIKAAVKRKEVLGARDEDAKSAFIKVRKRFKNSLEGR